MSAANNKGERLALYTVLKQKGRKSIFHDEREYNL